MQTLSDGISRELAAQAAQIAQEFGVEVDVCIQHFALIPTGDRYQLAINDSPLTELLDEPGCEANLQMIRERIELLAKQAG